MYKESRQYPQETPAMTITADTFTEQQESSLTRLSHAALVIAIGLFISSLFFPVFITQAHDIHGYWVLAMGWLGFINFQFAWYATPFAILAVHVAKKSPQLGLFLSIVALIIASEAFLFTDIPFGSNDKVSDYGIGFYLWYLCFYMVSFSILLNLVAWGSGVEEEKGPLQTQSEARELLHLQADERTLEGEGVQDNPSLSTATMAKVKRIIVPKAKVKQPVVNAWLYSNTSATPPSLPKKNVFLAKEKRGITPPPLPEDNLYIKKEMLNKTPPALSINKWFALPPALPKLKKAMTPPPLPVRKLAIAPFLDYKLKANYRSYL